MNSYISSWNVQVPLFYSFTLAFIFKVKDLEFFLFCEYLANILREIEQIILLTSDRMYVFAIEWRLCECCTSWPWHTRSRSGILKCEHLYIKTDLFNPVCGRQYKFSPKILLHFPLFQDGVVNTYSQFSRKLFDWFGIFRRVMIKVLELCKKWAVWMKVAAQQSSFSTLKMCQWDKEEKKRWISSTLFNRFS